jgi:hypothetical protein
LSASYHEQEVGLRDGVGVADANQPDRLTGVSIDRDERVGPDIGDGDARIETVANCYSDRKLSANWMADCGVSS